MARGGQGRPLLDSEFAAPAYDFGRSGTAECAGVIRVLVSALFQHAAAAASRLVLVLAQAGVVLGCQELQRNVDEAAHE